MFYEDVDLCRRIRQAGGSIWFTDATHAVHEGEHSTSTARAEMACALVDSRFLYFIKWYGRSSASVVTLFNIIGSLARALAWKVGGRAAERDVRVNASIAAAQEGFRVLIHGVQQ